MFELGNFGVSLNLLDKHSNFMIGEQIFFPKFKVEGWKKLTRNSQKVLKTVVFDLKHSTLFIRGITAATFFFFFFTQLLPLHHNWPGCLLVLSEHLMNLYCLVLAILDGKIHILNDQADIFYVPDKTSVKLNLSEGKPGQPLEKNVIICFCLVMLTNFTFLYALEN
jgi:hypothetical protein